MTVAMPPPFRPYGSSSKKSQFSDMSLSTLESLLLECALEDARQKAAAPDEDWAGQSSQSLTLTDPYEMAASDYDALKQLPGNDHCADCDSTDTEWASVTFGILLCTRCSGRHRSLGTHISRVRSIKMDSWTSEHLERMKAGGNGRWKAVWQQDQQQVLIEGQSFSDKYDSATARMYSQQLLSQEESSHNLDTDGTDNLKNTTRSREDRSSNGRRSRTPSPIWAMIENDDDGNTPITTTITATVQPIQPRHIAASSPTITYMGRSFPACSVTLKCNYQSSSSPLQTATTSASNANGDSNDNKSIMDLLFFGKKDSQEKTSTTSNSDNKKSTQNRVAGPSKPHHYPKQKRHHPKRPQHDQLNVTDRYPAAAVLLYSYQDVLDITENQQEFAHLQRTLKHNGAITNEVIRQRMFAFVLNRKKRRKEQELLL